MKKITCILLYTLVLLTASCAKYDQRLQILDVQKPQIFKVQKKADQGAVHSINIKGIGRLDGDAEVLLMQDGQPYRRENMRGKVNFSWSSEWYSDSVEIRYQPRTVSSGSLVIEYRFSDVK